MKNDTYKKAMQIDSSASEKYFNSSLEKKTEQQKILEELLSRKNFEPKQVADIACGGGGATLHLSQIFQKSKFTLVDVNEDAIELAKKALDGIDASFNIGDIYNLDLDSNSFDLVVCWQTLSWLDQPEAALNELVRICKPGGYIYASSLFNL